MMKRIFTIAISCILSVTCILSFFGCKNEDSKVIPPDNSVELTDISLYVGGQSKYKIVLPENASDYENFAKDELVAFFEQSTGYEFEVITDSGLTFSQNDYYISLGNTSVYRGSGVEASYDELGRDGYKCVLKGNTLIICGGAGYGTVYGVYDFLEKTVGWHAYAPDEIVVDRLYRIYMPAFDITEIPDFENRSGGYYVTYNNKIFSTRSRVLDGPYNRLFEENGIWGSWAHNVLGYLPVATYADEHPDWYSSDQTQLCLSNMEMRTEMFEKVKENIIKNSDSELFMIGQEDKDTFCDCDNCKAITSQITESGLMMQFINDIARRVKEWQKTACPDRVIKLGTFAYQKTQAPPVDQNKQGEYVLRDPSVKAEDNVFVCIAPIYADWSVPIDDVDHNTTSRTMIYGWQAVSDQLMVWGYCNNFNMCLEYFDNINTIATNYKIYRDAGVMFLFDESGGTVKQNFMFQTMMGYLHAELMWDCEQNVEQLITSFMDAYYKDASVPMKKLFDLMRFYVTARKQELSLINNTHYGTGIWRSDANKTLLSREFWKKSVLDQMLSYVDQAIEAVNNGNYTPDVKNTLIQRITIESLTPRMYLLHNFSSDIEKDEYYAMIDQFESDMSELGVSSVFSGQSTSQTMEEWRSNKI